MENIIETKQLIHKIMKEINISDRDKVPYMDGNGGGADDGGGGGEDEDAIGEPAGFNDDLLCCLS